jgi:hypothetical protein
VNVKVRFATSSLRCRITHAELDRLLSGREVALEVALPPGNVLRVSMRPTTMGSWRLESDPTGIWLTVPRAALESLALSLPSKEGVLQEFETSAASVQVSVEVDVRPQSG